MNPADGFKFQLESPAPAQAEAGRLVVTGWCLHSNTARPPAVRLLCAGLVLPVHSRQPRPDVCTAQAAPAGALDCGFVITGTIPTGVHVARLEASENGTDWYALHRFTLAATPKPLQAALEGPASRVIRESTCLRGWCTHPEHPINEIWLHYGHRRVRCDHGLPLPEGVLPPPGSPDASHAGFLAREPLPAGRGPLRLCAVPPGGHFYFRTELQVAIEDEPPLGPHLATVAPRLTPAPWPAPAALPGPPAATPRRILFVLYGDMTANSALHVAALANELAQAGHECVVAVPLAAESIRFHPGARFRCVDFAACGERAELFTGHTPPDIIHAWTPREGVRRLCQRLCASGGPRLVVHLEDHELHILETTLGRPLAELAALPPAELDALVGDAFTHPQHGAEFLAGASACTVILDRLLEQVPPGKPARVIWPAAAADFLPRPIPWDLRAALGWGADHTVLFYHGNLHPANRDELAALYEAVVRLNAAGTPTTLLRTGCDACPLPGDLGERAAPHVVALGRIGRQRHLAPLMALADFFVQPGESDPFNDFRFPSKLPEFFASGRPVILPRTNIGTLTRHGLDAFVLERADAASIAEAITTLRRDPELAARLASGAADFSRQQFSWSRSAETLAQLYDSLF